MSSILSGFRRIVQPPPDVIPTTPGSPNAASGSASRDPLFLPEPGTDGETQSTPSGSTSDSGWTPGNRRRPRDDDTSDVATLHGSIPPPMAKRLKTYAHSVCNSLELDPAALDSFVECSSLPFMLVDIMGNLLAAQKMSTYDRVFRYLHTKEFSVPFQNRITACLLSPNLTSYCGPALTARLIDLMRKDPAVMRVPVEVLEYDALFEQVAAMIPQALSDARGAIRNKLLYSLGPEIVSQVVKLAKGGKTLVQRARLLNIADLTTSMIPKTLILEVRSNHWMRVAFLRAALMEFYTVVLKCGPLVSSAPTPATATATATQPTSAPTDAPSPTSRSASPNPDANVPAPSDEQAQSDDPSTEQTQFLLRDYWQYVDTQLLAMRNMVVEQNSTQEDQENAWQEYFTQLLQDDMKLYKGKHPAGPKPTNTMPAFSYQAVIEEHMIW
ncbi:hypothetical protein C8Q73DRAFT_694691 [Cubamyces lactineus]|nr:hypothetical protein C8Q73DRAFT_694628 [Cubamyces lactineus]KAH9894144.1 hypothetical protein C8Q73DRAFT_694691 [Cubamyces lactineus]